MTTDLWVRPRPEAVATGAIVNTIIIVQITAEGIKYRLPLEHGKVQECNHRYLTRYWVIEDCNEYWEIMDKIHDDNKLTKYIMSMVRDRMEFIGPVEDTARLMSSGRMDDILLG